MPYSMLWNSGTGLVAHNFGITPIVFRPLKELTGVKGVIDADVPSFFKNPHWCTDWTDAAVAGVEPLSNAHYPPFRKPWPRPDDGRQIDEVVDWSFKGTHPCQANNLHKPLFYPSKKTFNDELMQAAAFATAKAIQTGIKQKEQKP
jgi:hypothetical protein